MKILRTLASIAIAVGVTAVVMPAGNAATLEELRAKGFIRAGIHNEAPYAYITEDGTPKGLGPEVATYIYNKLGIKEIDWVVTPFSTLIPGLQAGRWDVVASQQTIKPDRCAVVSFSRPMSAVGEALLVKSGNPKNLHSYDDIKKDSSVKVAVPNGTTHVKYLQSYGIGDDQMVLIQNHSDATELLLSGRVDSYVLEDASGSKLMQDGKVKDVELAEPFTQPIVDGKAVTSYASHTFRQDDTELREAYSKELEEFMKTPEFAEIVSRNGLPAASTERALAMSTEERCKPQ